MQVYQTLQQFDSSGRKGLVCLLYPWIASHFTDGQPPGNEPFTLDARKLRRACEACGFHMLGEFTAP